MNSKSSVFHSGTPRNPHLIRRALFPENDRTGKNEIHRCWLKLPAMTAMQLMLEDLSSYFCANHAFEKYFIGLQPNTDRNTAIKLLELS